MANIYLSFLLSAFIVNCMGQLERCPGLVSCSRTTAEKFKATNITAVKCAALHEGLNCLETVKLNCPESYRITLERTISYSRTELSRLQCNSAAANSFFYVIFIVISTFFVFH